MLSLDLPRKDRPKARSPIHVLYSLALSQSGTMDCQNASSSILQERFTVSQLLLFGVTVVGACNPAHNDLSFSAANGSLQPQIKLTRTTMKGELSYMKSSLNIYMDNNMVYFQ